MINDNSVKANYILQATCGNKNAEVLKPLSVKKDLKERSGTISITYSMGDKPLLWDEFNPELYNMHISLQSNNETDEKDIAFGMREFKSSDTQLLINGRPTFLRGTLECAVTPLTGYPSTENAYWKNIFTVAKSYGLNHLRFHSWCPPEAAFDAADSAVFICKLNVDHGQTREPRLEMELRLIPFIYDESNAL